jgi:hypothetical protein
VGGSGRSWRVLGGEGTRVKGTFSITLIIIIFFISSWAEPTAAVGTVIRRGTHAPSFRKPRDNFDEQ